MGRHDERQQAVELYHPTKTYQEMERDKEGKESCPSSTLSSVLGMMEQAERYIQYSNSKRPPTAPSGADRIKS